MQTGPCPCWRQRGRWVIARRQGAILAQGTASFTKLWAGSQLLTKSSWDPGPVDIYQEGCSQISTTQRRHMAHLRQYSCGTPGTVCSPSTGHLSSLGLGRAQNASPTESVPLWSTWEPEPEQLRARKCTKPRARFGQLPCRTTWSLSSVDWESTCAVSWGKPSVVHTLRALPIHTSDMFAVFFPPHSTTEQVSLNKWPPWPPCVRAEIRHWTDLQTEEAKINKEEGTALEVTGATD